MTKYLIFHFAKILMKNLLFLLNFNKLSIFQLNINYPTSKFSLDCQIRKKF